ncbi:Non-ribosomal peptide synthetase [Kitasatospora sp. MMS16-BH015]|uniref:fatty acyl-AMP ligase n=1 Tax=Kitasatospora sp. MMS16-BH015 TaxID=2018025 RepID=UPI000CA32FBF|nr:fatty acyl-AMP ligase [Kitasatospora sp. MMS16-BH015]AUG78205.1 Non-ribosomal peptide synthetase [Kitasatospora sp. MMS16-BH015]
MTIDITGHATFAAAFTAQVAAQPDRLAVAVTTGSADPAPQLLSFAELDRRARVRARELSARLSPGARVILALPTSVEFVETYTACLLAGLVAVPVPVPGRSSHASGRVGSIIQDCSAELVLTLAEEVETLAGWLYGQGLGEVAFEAVAPVPADADASDWTAPVPAATTIGVLQYSSGSTGTPKGVMLSQGNIVANVQALADCCELGPEDRFGGWIPMHHDMGLFTQLSAGLLLGLGCVLMPPGEFVKRPIEWLRVLDAYDVTVSAGPDFAFDLSTRLVTEEQLKTVDLSKLRSVLNGSEPIHAPTLAAFSARFAAAGLRPEAVAPGYGLAEATVFVSCKAPAPQPTVLTVDPAAAERGELLVAAQGRQIVGCGVPTGLEARIADPETGRELPAGRIGELWLRGPSVGHGYWNRPEQSDAVFNAVLDPAEGEPTSGWLRTGDLCCLIGGELFITGRLKEMMVVRGRNLFPQDLEQEARAASPALTGFFGAAFAVPAPDERVVLVHEVAPATPREELPKVAGAVRQRLSAVLGAPARNVVLVRRGSIRRTTSGKIQRTAMRDLFLAGELTSVHCELEPAVERLLAEARPAEAVLVGGAA